MNLEKLIAWTLFILCLLVMICGFVVSNTTSTTSPVEDSRIDSIKINNAKLIIEVESLDSIKNVKTVEVKALDNDSTLKLFYELIGK